MATATKNCPLGLLTDSLAYNRAVFCVAGLSAIPAQKRLFTFVFALVRKSRLGFKVLHDVSLRRFVWCRCYPCRALKKYCNPLFIFKTAKSYFMYKTCLKSAYFLTLLCFILIMDGCKEDTCSRVCQNGYLEDDCTCNCPLDYSGANCETQLSKLVLYDSIGTQKEVFYYIKGDILTLKSSYNLNASTGLSIFHRSPNCTGNCFWAKGTYPEENLGRTITFVGVDSVYYVNQWFTQNVGIGGGGPYFTLKRHSWKGVIR